MYDLKSNGSCDLTRLYDNSYDDKTLLDTLKLTIKCWRSSDKIYKILKYDKKYLTEDKIQTTGLFRSVICKDGKIFHKFETNTRISFSQKVICSMIFNIII